MIRVLDLAADIGHLRTQRAHVGDNIGENEVRDLSVYMCCESVSALDGHAYMLKPDPCISNNLIYT